MLSKGSCLTAAIGPWPVQSDYQQLSAGGISARTFNSKAGKISTSFLRLFIWSTCVSWLKYRFGVNPFQKLQSGNTDFVAMPKKNCIFPGYDVMVITERLNDCKTLGPLMSPINGEISVKTTILNILRGLADIHLHGLLHRDINHYNVLYQKKMVAPSQKYLTLTFSNQ